MGFGCELYINTITHVRKSGATGLPLSSIDLKFRSAAPCTAGKTPSSTKARLYNPNAPKFKTVNLLPTLRIIDIGKAFSSDALSARSPPSPAAAEGRAKALHTWCGLAELRRVATTGATFRLGQGRAGARGGAEDGRGLFTVPCVDGRESVPLEPPLPVIWRRLRE